LVTGDLKVSENQGDKRGEGISSRISPLPIKRLFSIKEAAVYLSKGVFGVRTLIWNGDLPIVRDGRRILLDRNDLDGFIEKNKTAYFTREADERPNNGKKKISS